MPFTPRFVVLDYSGGANTRDFEDNIAPNQSPYPLNVEFDGLTVRKARGFKRLTSGAYASGECHTLFSHRILADEEVLIKPTGGTLTFFDQIGNIGIPVGDSLFPEGRFFPITTQGYDADAEWFFATFNGYLYANTESGPFTRWRASAWATLDHAILQTDIVIDLSTGEGSRFPASGSGFIAGHTFTWTGVTGDQLTGVTLESDSPAGSRVIMAADASTYSSNPNGSVGAFFRNRLYIRKAEAHNFLYFSKLADATNPEDDIANFTISGSGTGDAGFIIFPAAILGVRVFIAGSNEPVLVAYCADGIAYSVSVADSGSTTVGSCVPFKVLGETLIAQKAIAVTENEIVALTGKGTMRAIGYGETSTTVKTSRLSDIIRPTMEAVDFSDGAMVYSDRKVLMQGKVNGADVNNFTVVRATDPGGFCFYDFLQMNDFVEWKTRLISVSSLDGKVYQLQTGYSADGNPIRTSYATHASNFMVRSRSMSQLGISLIMKQALKMRVTGFITNNCNLFFKVYLDDSTTPYIFKINGSDSNVTSVNEDVAIGTVAFAGIVIGGGLPEGVVRKRFRASFEIPNMDFFYLMKIVVENNEADVDFALDKMAVFAQVMQPDVELDMRELATDESS